MSLSPYLWQVNFFTCVTQGRKSVVIVFQSIETVFKLPWFIYNRITPYELLFICIFFSLQVVKQLKAGANIRINVKWICIRRACIPNTCRDNVPLCSDVFMLTCKYFTSQRTITRNVDKLKSPIVLYQPVNYSWKPKISRR